MGQCMSESAELQALTIYFDSNGKVVANRTPRAQAEILLMWLWDAGFRVVPHEKVESHSKGTGFTSVSPT